MADELSGTWTCEACGATGTFSSTSHLIEVDHPAVHFAGVFAPLPRLIVTLDPGQVES